MKSTRLIAFEILYKIFSNHSYSNIAVDRGLSGSTADSAFVSALVYGVVERKITLDYFIEKYLDKKPKAKVLILLRMGAYQLLFMDKVPAGAAINESVRLTKELKLEFYSGLINAVLHKIDNDRQIPDDLSVAYSVPQNLIRMWEKQYGREQMLKILSCVNGKPPVFAIPNRFCVDADELIYELNCEGIDAEKTDGVVRIDSHFNIRKCRAFESGLFYIQDLSSYQCALELKAQPGETVLDLCASPGGKAFTIAQEMKNQGKIYAYDLYRHRCDLIDSGAQRLGITIIESDVNDARIYNKQIPMADKIFCDVPCSGFGIIRRKPEIRYKELDSIDELPVIQAEILETAGCYLKPGGRLLYSTCTLNKKENQKVIRSFLEHRSDFELIAEKTVFPTENGGDGFYYGVMESKK